MWRMNLAILTSHSGGVALAVKVPGSSHRAMRIPPTRRSKHKKKSNLIRLNMEYLCISVYLVGDFHHKSDLGIRSEWLRAHRYMEDNPESADSEARLRKTTMPETLF